MPPFSHARERTVVTLVELRGYLQQMKQRGFAVLLGRQRLRRVEDLRKHLQPYQRAPSPSS
jgi:hypothetical protein